MPHSLAQRLDVGNISMRWSASKQTWHERIGAAALLAGAALFLWSLLALSLPAQLLFGAFFFVLAAFLLGQGWVRIVGPVFRADLLRMARRRVIGPRTVYLSVLLIAFLATCATVSDGLADSYWTLFANTRLPARMLADLASIFSGTVLIVQFCVGCALAPIVGSAIPQEKRRRTLDFLLATDVRNHEIVLGILLSRLAQIGLLILAGLPVFCLLQLLGGVDPMLVLIAFGITALTMISLASLAMLCSIYAKRPVGAILTTYGAVALYVALTGSLKCLLMAFPVLSGFPSRDNWASPVTLGELAEWSNIGNPGAAFVDIALNFEKGVPLNDLLQPILENYCWFHGVLIVVCLVWASLRIRAVALKQAGRVARRRSADRARRWSWGLDRWTLLWKETHARRGLAVRIGSAVLALAGAGVVLFLLGLFAFTIPSIPWRELRLVMNIWMRVAANLVACLILVNVAARAASSISGERDQQTLDMLLTTPQSSRNILFAKWLGSMLSTWRAWLWLGAIWAVGWFTGSVPLTDIPGLFLACAILTMAVASMGIWVSAASPTSSRALSSTFAMIVLVWVGHWALMPLAEYQFNWSRWNLQWLWKLETYTFTPPLAFDYLASRNYLIAENWRSPYAGAELQEFDDTSSYCWLGMALWFTVSIAFVCLAELRFAAVIGRRKRALPVAPPAEKVRVVPELALAAKE